MVRRYILNQAGESVDTFPWVQAFEAWAQRTRTTYNWSHAEHSNTSARWSATATFETHRITGYGQNKKQAERDAVIKIEKAGILYI
ncbi:hypothetical protein RSOLAG22IIIB_02039 [Rhizoctonia solani]|uniref:DRBM domain-containing protein n=1 Tax=Rhizoctonia solani TaxID=456999 RepID=A0A0K6GBQ6_9AGAM|nr:hypothetical protein RSOLAG22IIIB_02039 [Rhizoctonia solani]